MNTANYKSIGCKNGTIEWLNPRGSKTFDFYLNGQPFNLCLRLRKVPLSGNSRVSASLIQGAGKHDITNILQAASLVPTCFWSHCGHVIIELDADSDGNSMTRDSYNIQYQVSNRAQYGEYCYSNIKQCSLNQSC